MRIVLLQNKLSEHGIREMIHEFPSFFFLAPREVHYRQLGDEEWARIEIIYGNHLTEEELAKTRKLRWIHSPVPNLDPLCLNALDKKDIIVTTTREENTAQIGEYVIGGILAYAKNLFHWEAADKNPTLLWDSKWRDSMWMLKDRIFLQIGLGKVGTEIARRAKLMEMRVWGIQETRTFHPHCQKVFNFQDLPTILPAVDVVSLALPRAQQKTTLFRKKEFELMKEDAILVIIGSKGLIDEEALLEIATTQKKFRGILFDAFYQKPISPSSPLWNIPNILITPEVAPRPKLVEKEAYHTFRYNFRQYAHNNFTDMRNRVGSKATFLT